MKKSDIVDDSAEVGTPIGSFQRGGIPAYRQITQLLRGRISGGRYQSRLPTEDTLMREFQVGRQTIRAAVAKLVEEGLVERFPGRGSFVLPPDQRVSSWHIRSLEDILDQRFPEPPQVMGAKFVNGSDDLEAAGALQIDHAKEMYYILALRLWRGRPFSCSQIFLPSEIGGALANNLPKHIASTPMIQAIERECHLPIVRAVQTVTATIVSEEIAGPLDIPAKSTVLVLLRTYFTAGDRPVEYVRMFGQPDRFRQTIEFTRQRA